MTTDEGITFEPQGRWWRANNLLLPSITQGLTLPRRVTLLESTLREGEETPGAYLTEDTKVRLAHRLDEFGLREIEVGYVGTIAEHYPLVKRLKREGIRARIASHQRMYAREGEWQAEIDRAIDAGCDILTFVIFGSEPMLRATPWLRADELPERIAACIARARAQHVSTTFSLAAGDLFRTPLSRIVACYQAAVGAKADRVYVSDGTGTATPEAISFFTMFLRDLAGPDVEIALHLHNTFGLATANSLAAITHGASAVDTCVLGLGDAAGITPTEEIALALRVLYGIETDVQPEDVTELCDVVAEAFQMEIPAQKPFVGKNIYRHQIDSHIGAILRGGWSMWEVIRAEALGRTRRLEFAYGKLRSGRSGGLATKVEQMGISITDEQLEMILAGVRRLTVEKQFASESEVEAVIRATLAASKEEG